MCSSDLSLSLSLSLSQPRCINKDRHTLQRSPKMAGLDDWFSEDEEKLRWESTPPPTLPASVRLKGTNEERVILERKLVRELWTKKESLDRITLMSTVTDYFGDPLDTGPRLDGDQFLEWTTKRFAPPRCSDCYSANTLAIWSYAHHRSAPPDNDVGTDFTLVIRKACPQSDCAMCKELPPAGYPVHVCPQCFPTLPFCKDKNCNSDSKQPKSMLCGQPKGDKYCKACYTKRLAFAVLFAPSVEPDGVSQRTNRHVDERERSWRWRERKHLESEHLLGGPQLALLGARFMPKRCHDCWLGEEQSQLLRASDNPAAVKYLAELQGKYELLNSLSVDRKPCTDRGCRFCASIPVNGYPTLVCTACYHTVPTCHTCFAMICKGEVCRKCAPNAAA